MCHWLWNTADNGSVMPLWQLSGKSSCERRTLNDVSPVLVQVQFFST